MTTCPDTAPPPFTCPTLEQSVQATAALWPRGKAWPAGDPGIMAAFLAWLDPANSNVWTLSDVWAPPDIWWFNAPAAPADWPAGYVQCGFTAALGTVCNWIESRFCALKEEFFCATANETLDLWNAEYGLPDQCDPLPNLCAKVATIGGTPNCAYWTSLAAELGWSISCATVLQGAGSQFGSSQCGTAQFGTGIQPTVIDITVHLASSPAYGGALSQLPIFGPMQFGDRFGQEPNITPLTCAFDRLLPAHLTFNYVTVDD
jgi:uncharacterized protein YmfQ (DUF2313 family)